MYSIDEIIEIFKKHEIFLNIEEGTFFVYFSVRFIDGTKIFISNEIMSQLGFLTFGDVTFELTDRTWRNRKAETPLKIPRELHVCLEELKTSNNYKNGKPSTILEVLPANLVEEKINFLGYSSSRNIFESKKTTVVTVLKDLIIHLLKI